MELKANELRIGNWIRTSIDEQVCDVLSDCINTHEHECLLYDMIAPIPLTEEWLDRLGFKVKMGSVTHNHSFIKNDFLLNNGLRSGISYDGIEINYVHQLQNLYFALTGEELELSPK